MGKRKMQQVDQGYTLLELIICIAIVAVVGTIIARNIFSSSTLFQKTGSQVNLSIELQRVTDAIGDDLLECSEVEKITEEESDADIRYLLRKSQKQGMLYFYDSSAQILYRKELQISLTEEEEKATNADSIIDAKMKAAAEATYEESELQKISLYVTSIAIQKVQDGNSNVNLTVSCEVDGKTAQSQKQIRLRNYAG